MDHVLPALFFFYLQSTWVSSFLPYTLSVRLRLANELKLQRRRSGQIFGGNPGRLADWLEYVRPVHPSTCPCPFAVYERLAAPTNSLDVCESTGAVAHVGGSPEQVSAWKRVCARSIAVDGSGIPEKQVARFRHG